MADRRCLAYGGGAAKPNTRNALKLKNAASDRQCGLMRGGAMVAIEFAAS